MTVSISTQRRRVEAGASSPHVELRVYAGPDPEHRAYVGALRMRTAEAAEFEARVRDRKPEAEPEGSGDMPWAVSKWTAGGWDVLAEFRTEADAEEFLGALARHAPDGNTGLRVDAP